MNSTQCLPIYIVINVPSIIRFDMHLIFEKRIKHSCSFNFTFALPIMFSQLSECFARKSFCFASTTKWFGTTSSKPKQNSIYDQTNIVDFKTSQVKSKIAEIRTKCDVCPSSNDELGRQQTMTVAPSYHIEHVHVANILYRDALYQWQQWHQWHWLMFSLIN